MSVEKSPNCTNYTDTVSTLVEVTATVPGHDRCVVKFPAFSCQKKAFEKPDDTTKGFMSGLASTKLQDLGCDIENMQLSFKTNLMGAQDMEYSASKLAKGGMASNCFQTGNDPREHTHKITAKCNPMYDMTDADGNRVRNFNMTFNSDLAACDVSDEAVPQLLEDARKVAAHNAAVNGYTIDKPEHLACTFSILPHV